MSWISEGWRSFERQAQAIDPGQQAALATFGELVPGARGITSAWLGESPTHRAAGLLGFALGGPMGVAAGSALYLGGSMLWGDVTRAPRPPAYSGQRPQPIVYPLRDRVLPDGTIVTYDSSQPTSQEEAERVRNDPDRPGGMFWP